MKQNNYKVQIWVNCMIVRVRPHHYWKLKQILTSPFFHRWYLLAIGRFIYGKHFYDLIVKIYQNDKANIGLEITPLKSEDALCIRCRFFKVCGYRHKSYNTAEFLGKLNYHSARRADHRIIKKLELQTYRIYKHNELFK